MTGNPTANLACEHLSKISMPHVARNVWANTAPGQLVRAVQVGEKPPASQYFAGGIRIGVYVVSSDVLQNISRPSAPIRMKGLISVCTAFGAISAAFFPI